MQTRLKTMTGFLDKPANFSDRLRSNDSKVSSSCDQLTLMKNTKTWTRGRFHMRVLECGLLRPDSVLLPELSNVRITHRLRREMNLRPLIQNPEY